MARPPKLAKKKVGKLTYWYTKAGGQGEVYFGRVDQVPKKEADKLFFEHLQSLTDEKPRSNALTCHQLTSKFLDWLKIHRGQRTYDQRRLDCKKFANFKVKQGQKVGELPALKIRAEDLEDWLAHCRVNEGLGPQTLRHRQTSIKHCWNWAIKHSYLPQTFRPFLPVEPIYVPPKLLTEEALMTHREAEILFEAAKVDLDEFHRFGPKKPRDHNPYEDFSDMLKCYYHTGARTHELARVEVGDFLRKTRQVVLGQHKTSKTQRQHRVRRITLNDEAFEVFQRFTKGKKKSDKVFTTSDNTSWKKNSLPTRFTRVKEVAELKKIGKVRDHITIYDFRHLWVSDTLMTPGNDITTTARMAGTSIAMIEKVYGHFRNVHLQETQSRTDQYRAQFRRRQD